MKRAGQRRRGRRRGEQAACGRRSSLSQRQGEEERLSRRIKSPAPAPPHTLTETPPRHGTLRGKEHVGAATARSPEQPQRQHGAAKAEPAGSRRERGGVLSPPEADAGRSVGRSPCPSVCRRRRRALPALGRPPPLGSPTGKLFSPAATGPKRDFLRQRQAERLRRLRWSGKSGQSSSLRTTSLCAESPRGQRAKGARGGGLWVSWGGGSLTIRRSLPPFLWRGRRVSPPLPGFLWGGRRESSGGGKGFTFGVASCMASSQPAASPRLGSLPECLST